MNERYKLLSLRLHGKNDIRLEKIDIPVINDEELLVKVLAAAVCGTDVRMWQNSYNSVDNGSPLVLGHEFAGEIVEVGKSVEFFKIGMKVAVAPNIGCGTCDRCVRGDFHLCDNFKAFGININGAFAEYVKIPKSALLRGNLILLPDGVSPEEAALNEPLSCAYNGFTKCFVKPGEYALVVGAGPIGIMHTQLLLMAGCSKVILNDLSLDRLKKSKAFLPKIETYIGDSLSDFIFKLTNNKGLDIAIVACPVPQVQAAMLPLMDYGGRINFFGGVPKDKQPVAIDTNIVHYKELYLTGSTRASIDQYKKTLGFIQNGLVDLKSLISRKFPLKDVLKAFEYAKSAEGFKNIITFE